MKCGKCNIGSTTFRQKFRVIQSVSYQLNYIYNDPQTHRGVCLDPLEPFRIKFRTFEKILRNVPRKIPCFPDCVILGKASLR